MTCVTADALLKQRLHICLRVKRLQIIHLFADADKLHRQAQLLLDGEDRSTLRGSVQLGSVPTGKTMGVKTTLNMPP